MSVHTFVFMGCPGSGKGMQAKLLSGKLGHPIFSIGGRLREIALEKTPLATHVGDVINSGELMPSWFVTYLFEDVLLHLDKDRGIIFDGVGRKEEEARVFADTSNWLGRDFRVVNLIVPEEMVYERLKKRQVEGRRDDKPERLKTRFDNFKEHTLPAIEFFRSLGKVIDVNGEPTPEEVFTVVLEKVSALS